jgi:hypothetical protein
MWSLRINMSQNILCVNTKLPAREKYISLCKTIRQHGVMVSWYVTTGSMVDR